jgi:hypothetical protein
MSIVPKTGNEGAKMDIRVLMCPLSITSSVTFRIFNASLPPNVTDIPSPSAANTRSKPGQLRTSRVTMRYPVVGPSGGYTENIMGCGPENVDADKADADKADADKADADKADANNVDAENVHADKDNAVRVIPGYHRGTSKGTR